MQRFRLVFVLLLLCQFALHASTSLLSAPDTCTINDFCEDALFIPLLPTDTGFECINGCTNGALPQAQNTACVFEQYPTVWYWIETDSFAAFLNIQVRSDEMETPAISVYKPITGCTDLEAVDVCNKGAGGELDVLGVAVLPATTYLIAVTAFHADTGQFELCINTLSQNNICVLRRSIEMVSRNAGGALTGPFLPGETVRVCMMVDSFTAQYNQCQWFQGIVPSFGNGWSPNSFDSIGQPMNATINGFAMGVSGNGLYGNAANPATFDWFNDVTYHWPLPFYKLGDFDNNGTKELCNNRFDSYCAGNMGFLAEACCFFCRDDTRGTLLPPGWFSYGINGTCAERGPPIRWDWGDGNSCGGGMGSWKFCFDLQIKNFSECSVDTAKDDLTITMHTFADGEVGSGYGPSVCALDQPVITRLPLLCTPTKRLDEEVLPNLCDGLSMNYLLHHDDVVHWTWNASPADVIRTTVFEADNGHFIIDEYDIDVDTPVLVNYTFIGEQSGTDTLLIKNVSFYVLPQINIDLPEVIYVCKKERRPVIIRPVISGGDSASMQFAWSPVLGDADTIVIYPPFEAGTLNVVASDAAGCFDMEDVQINVRPCLGGPNPPTDDNDHPVPQDSLPTGGNFKEEVAIQSRAHAEYDFTIQPIPAHDQLIITLSQVLTSTDRLVITDMHGALVAESGGDGVVKKEITLDVNSWPAGLYIVTLYSGQGTISKRIIKM